MATQLKLTNSYATLKEKNVNAPYISRKKQQKGNLQTPKQHIKERKWNNRLCNNATFKWKKHQKRTCNTQGNNEYNYAIHNCMQRILKRKKQQKRNIQTLMKYLREKGTEM